VTKLIVIFYSFSKF